ncbi:MAG TPA: TniB family NTP-binding protein [Acetobacteraceae bacterium]|nr:TniB family NTP-binding protein [Acetobacteraceae bacterium]
MAADIGAAHLDEAVRPDLLLPDAHRIARIDRDRWIGYSRARIIIDGLERILRSERRQRPDNLLIVGASNNGKTAIARRFIARQLPPENPNATISAIPVTLVQAPNGPRVPQLLTAIRTALGQPPGRRESTAQLRLETYRIMHAVGLRLLLIDDLDDIRGAGMAPILVQLREIGSVVGVSLGCFATREIAYALRQDDQLANRFELMTLPRWQIEEPDYWRLLHTFGRRLPLRSPSTLTDPDLATHILALADGLIGAIRRLLRYAAAAAIRTGHECIDRAMLDLVETTTPARIEALAVSEQF